MASFNTNSTPLLHELPPVHPSGQSLFVVLDYPDQHAWDVAEVFAKCADRAGGFDDLTHPCPICGSELNAHARSGRRAMSHLDGCFWDLAVRITKGERMALGELAYCDEQAALADGGAGRYVRETPTAYSIIPTVRQRQRIVIDGKRFAVGDHVAVLARPIAGEDGQVCRPLVCTGHIIRIAERRGDYRITPSEVTFDLSGMLSPDGKPLAGLQTMTASAELVMPIEQQELGL